MTSPRVPRVTEDPLASLPVRPDGAITRELASDGTWQRVPGVKVPVLRGVKGEWHGYGEDDEDDWQHSYGWPNDYEAFRQTVLYAGDKVVAQLWFYRFLSRPDLTVLFVFTDMKQNADGSGDHMGSHHFTWWGELVA